MTKIKYSKNYNEIFNIKKNFYNENKKNYSGIIKINKKYIKEPKRTKCKICLTKLPEKIFYQHLVSYTLCDKCGHFNGLNEDSKKFTEWLYDEDDGKNYSGNYLKNYKTRVNKIYLAKVDFLKSTIKEKINIVDFGCGAGHFLKALELKKINGIGLETNNTLIKLGNKILKKNKILKNEKKNIEKFFFDDKNYNVLSMIAVLEHLSDPHEIIKLFIKSNMKYLYLSVPLFSLSVFIENSFKEIFPRHLGGGHTHLFTNNSIDYLKKKYNLKSVGEWWFGADFPDMYRSILNTSSNSNNKKYSKELNNYFFSVINELQNVLDRKKICSEVHLILKK